eukprot:1978167-Prymnesium_polylepis.1
MSRLQPADLRFLSGFGRALGAEVCRSGGDVVQPWLSRPGEATDPPDRARMMLAGVDAVRRCAAWGKKTTTHRPTPMRCGE